MNCACQFVNILAFFYKLSQFLPNNILKLLYFSLIYPRILYGIEIYANTYMTYLHNLIMLNNRILRITQRKDRFSDTRILYATFNTLPIDKLFELQLLLHAHALFYKSSKLPSLLHNKTIFNNDIHKYDTRSSGDFHRISMESSAGAKTSRNLCSKLWNPLPASIKSISSLSLFKKSLKLHLLNPNQ